jgi:FG-GAP repeat/FG-GAP-like repeat
MKLTRLVLSALAVFAGRAYLGAALVLTLAAAANASAPVLIQYTGTGTDHMGGAVAFGDVNGDGIPDIVVGADGGDYVRVFDGASPATQLYQFNGVPGSAFGSALATGDINGDGKADVVVGAFAWDGPAGTDQGMVRAFDGATGALLFELRGVKNTDTFGGSVALADIDGDGKAELLVGAPFADTRGTNSNTGYVKLFDGATQAELFRWDGPEHFDEMGRGVAFGDVNGDGVKDIVLGAGSGNRTDYGGFVWVIDGTNFNNRLYTFTDGKAHVKPEQNFGFAVAAADVNGDGKADVICGAYRGQTGPLRTDPATGYVRVFDGATGALLYQLNGELNGEQFGRYLAAGDLTGDGNADIVVGARWAALGGYVKVFDGPTGKEIDRQQADQDFEWLGSSVAVTDGGASGSPRMAAGAYQGDSRSPNPAGYVRVYSY